MYFFYLLKKYLKNFFIIFFAVSFIYATVSMFLNISKLPNSSNLVVLYFFYVFIYSALLLYPLSLIFSFLLTLNQMIKFNELVSFYSLGFEKNKLFKPFFYFSVLLTFFMFFLQSTRVVYSNEYAEAIKNSNKLSTRNIFLKYKNKVIFIKKLNPILKTARDVRVIELKNKEVSKVLFAKEAFFKNDRWFSDKVDVEVLTKNRWIKKEVKLSFLENFKPKIISNLQKLREISFYDAYLSIKYFRNFDLNTIFSIIFFKIFTPFSMIALMYFLFFTSPIHIRVSNTALFMVKSIAITIFIWGGMLLMYKFSKQGVLPFWSLSLPFLILVIINFIRRNNEF